MTFILFFKNPVQHFVKNFLKYILSQKVFKIALQTSC